MKAAAARRGPGTRVCVTRLPPSESSPTVLIWLRSGRDRAVDINAAAFDRGSELSLSRGIFDAIKLKPVASCGKEKRNAAVFLFFFSPEWELVFVSSVWHFWPVFWGERSGRGGYVLQRKRGAQKKKQTRLIITCKGCRNVYLINRMLHQHQLELQFHLSHSNIWANGASP